MSTPTTVVLIEEILERRRAEAAARARAHQDRERQARQQFVTRCGVDYDALVTTYRTLRALSNSDLSDLIAPPGFNLLDDGEVGSVNTDTPEWQLWSMLASLKDDAERIGHALLNAVDELKVAGHWDSNVGER